MGISFNSIPTNLRVPFVAVEFDNSQAVQGASQLPYQVLILGQKTSGGSGTANTLYQVSSADEVQALAGQGSQLHRMARAYFAENKFTTTFVGILSDNGSGVAATGNLSFTGPATAAGTIYLYIGGQLVTCGVASGDTAATIATNLTAAINANANLAVTAAVDGMHNYQVDLTAQNKGTNGNAIDVRFNYQVGQALPAGVACTITGMASGATNPVLTSMIAAMGDQWFQLIAHPYTDSTSLSAIETEMLSRFGPMRMIDGLAVTSGAGSSSTLATLGESRNCQSSEIVAQPGANPLTPPEEFAASTVGVMAYYAAIDPARPFQTLPMNWPLPPAISDQFTLSQRNTLLYDGIATTKVAAGDVVQLERMVTTYQKNPAGGADPSYLDATTMLTLMYLRYSFRQGILQQFPRSKLAQDGTRFGPGQAVVTPSIGKAYAISWFLEMETQGLVQNFDEFKANLQVQINNSDPNRLDFLLPPDIIGQFIVGAAQIQFQL